MKKLFDTVWGFLFPYESNRRMIVDGENGGYFLITDHFRGASKETKRVLLDLMPEEEWDEIREAALDAHANQGSFYPDEWSIFHEH